MEPETIEEILASARATIDRLTPEEAAVEVAGGALLIDTRDSVIRAAEGELPDAIAVPLSVLYWRLDPSSPFHDPVLARRERRVIVVCAHGYSSSLAAATLRRLGFERATDVIGGFEGWKRAGLRVELPQPG